MKIWKTLMLFVLTLLLTVMMTACDSDMQNKQKGDDSSNSGATSTPSTTTASQSHPSSSGDQNPYAPTGTLVLSDSLRDNNQGHQWTDTHDDATNGDCSFAAGAYHIIVPQGQQTCMASAPDLVFSNFTYEATVVIMTGDSAGLVFRANAANPTNTYLFTINTKGEYQLSQNHAAAQGKILSQGQSSAIKQGLNQTNLLAVVANNETLTAFVNGQQVANTQDSADMGGFSSGQIGLWGSGSSCNITTANVRVWKM